MLNLKWEALKNGLYLSTSFLWFHSVLGLIRGHCLCPISGWAQRRKGTGCLGSIWLGQWSILVSMTFWDFVDPRPRGSSDKSISNSPRTQLATESWEGLALFIKHSTNIPGSQVHAFNNLVKESRSSLANHRLWGQTGFSVPSDLTFSATLGKLLTLPKSLSPYL